MDGPPYSDLLNEAATLLAKQSACIRQLQAENAQLRGKVSRLETTNYALEIETNKWRFFYAATLRLYGDKQGKLGDMLRKAKARLDMDATAYAYEPEACEALETELATLLGDAWPAAVARDKQRRQAEFSKARDPEPILCRYGALTGYPRRQATPEDLAYRAEEESRRLSTGRGAFVDKRQAIEIIAREFKFPTWRAAFDFLKKARQKNLPADYPPV